jgi:flagellar hook assembly protein FlgD
MDVDNNVTPGLFILHQNYPNPFNPTTTIQYELPENSFVNIRIYDLKGRLVNTLVSKDQTAGYKAIKWAGVDDKGKPVSAGLYLYTIEAGDFRQTKKMVLLK